ncbi:hypothetical protein Dda_8071 [Drechslerella dactyloides]|uniref:YCII-related domain-containing protein n=1 Tax=Drechslerella dactyloides TaxID=74499 RepID=A0AAD6NG77_DREDA|nr:hypothetical protein Dda_8071 [Drechslerella dactyloides]
MRTFQRTISQLPSPLSLASLAHRRHLSVSKPRAMATEQYFVIVPDRPDAPRLEVRPSHFAKIAAENPAVSNTLMGGAYFSEQPVSVDPKEWGFAGSALVLELPAGSGEEGVREWIRNDPYATGGVWDAEKARIIKFRAGMSNAKDLVPPPK